MFEVESYRGTYTVELTESCNIPRIENSIGIVDSKVGDLYGDLLLPKVDQVILIDCACGEDAKTLGNCLDIIDRLLEMGVKKNTTLVAMGGGVIQDITSFIASILYRGINWSFIPTTLLAQADSCIGSKTSINHNDVKNLVGSFYPPSIIWCDSNLLKSLEESDIDSGIGEMLHYFMLYNSDYLNKIDNEDLGPCIAESLRIKKEMVEKDEFDQKERRIFNYGHTFGHAIEVLSSYAVKHGLAVTLGMHMANYVSYQLGLISKECLDYLQSKILFNMPDYSIDDVDYYMSILLKDKKNIPGALVCILPYDVADFRVTEISDIEALKDIIKDWIKASKTS